MSESTESIVIFGCGAMGLAVAEHLRRHGLRFHLTGVKPETVEAARSRGFGAIELDFTDDDALQSIGIGAGARLILCLYDEPSSNLFLTLSARSLAPTLTIISACESKESEAKLLAAGANTTIDPFVITGRWIHNLIRRPLVLKTLHETLFGNADMELAEVRLGDDSSMLGKRLGDVSMREYDLILLGLVAEHQGTQLIFRPAAQDRLIEAGDILVVLGPLAEINAFRETIGSAAAARQSNPLEA